jgi:hypothetical protein
LNSDFFIVTNLHIVGIKNKTRNGTEICPRKIMRISTKWNENITVGNIFISSTDIGDIALIKVDRCSISLQKYAVEVITKNDNNNNLGMSLIGCSIRNNKVFSQRCTLLSDDTKNLISDCGRSHGYSGTGYFNYDGILVGIHMGIRKVVEYDNNDNNNNYLDDIDENDDTDEDDYSSGEEEKKKLTKACSGNGLKSDTCINKVFDTMRVLSRNPRTNVEKAEKVWDILQDNNIFEKCIKY